MELMSKDKKSKDKKEQTWCQDSKRCVLGTCTCVLNARKRRWKYLNVSEESRSWEGSDSKDCVILNRFIKTRPGSILTNLALGQLHDSLSAAMGESLNLTA